MDDQLIRQAGVLSFTPTSPVVEILVYGLYSFLAFFEVLVLFAGAIGLLGFIIWQVLKKLRDLIDAVLDAGTADAKSDVKVLNPAGAAAGRRVRQVHGAHNERF